MLRRRRRISSTLIQDAIMNKKAKKMAEEMSEAIMKAGVYNSIKNNGSK